MATERTLEINICIEKKASRDESNNVNDLRLKTIFAFFRGAMLKILEFNKFNLVSCIV